MTTTDEMTQADNDGSLLSRIAIDRVVLEHARAEHRSLLRALPPALFEEILSETTPIEPPKSEEEREQLEFELRELIALAINARSTQARVRRLHPDLNVVLQAPTKREREQQLRQMVHTILIADQLAAVH
jgi:hypothetical protein